MLGALVASAQVQEQLSPTERKQLTKVTEPFTLYRGFLRANIFGSFASLGNAFDQDGNRITSEILSGSIIVSSFSIEYGVTDRFEISFFFPYVNSVNRGSVFIQQPGLGIQNVVYAKQKRIGVSDPAFNIRYQLLQDKAGSPSFVLGLGTYLPIGQSEGRNYVSPIAYDSPPAKGEWGIAPTLEIRKILYPISLQLRVSYQHYFGADKVLSPMGEPQRVISGSQFVILPQVNFHLNEWVSVYQQVTYSYTQKDDFEGIDFFGSHSKLIRSALLYDMGLTFQVKQLRLEQSVSVPLAGRFAPANTSYAISLSYMF